VSVCLRTNLNISFAVPTVAEGTQSRQHVINDLIRVTVRTAPPLHHGEVNEWPHCPVLLDLLHMLHGDVASSNGIVQALRIDGHVPAPAGEGRAEEEPAEEDVLLLHSIYI